VNTGRSDPQGCKARSKIAHKGRWPADEEVGVARHVASPQHRNVEASMRIEIAWPILGIG
jgi:hypothetical protein